jgi:hypothetical protein
MPSPKTTVAHTTPRDFFLYLFAAGSLYFAATTLITLLWQLVNVYFPEQPIFDYYSFDGISSILRWSVALLIIVFPAYMVTMWHLGKDIDKSPGKTELWVRRWFIWATLFIAAVTVTGDLVYLVYALLSGDLATRFILKALIVGGVAAAVFSYHWYLLRREPGKDLQKRRNLVIISSVFVGIAVIMGFVAVGSPARARAMRNDAERVSDLQNIQYQVTDYWQRKQKLPAAIDDLIDTANPMALPVDPQSKQAYRYQARGQYEFVLCTTFETEVTGNAPTLRFGIGPSDEGISAGSGRPATWDHAVGDTCFVRVIDPERYPSYKNLQPTIPVEATPTSTEIPKDVVSE